MSAGSQDFILSLETVRQFRHLLWMYEERTNTQQQNSQELMLQLHNLAADIQNIFKSSVIGNSTQYNSGKSTLKTKAGKSSEFQGQIYLTKKFDQPFNTPIKQIIQSLNLPQQQSSQFSRENYEQILYTNRQFQKHNKKLLKKLAQNQLKISELSQNLNQNQSAAKELKIQNNFLNNQNGQLNKIIQQLQSENRQLAQNDAQKSVLLKQIDDFLTNGGDSKPGSNFLITSSRVRNQNQRLIGQVIDLQQEIAHLSKNQNTPELLDTIERYQQQNRELKLKNQQLINIEESKKLNQIVHKENKHLLQVNYELGNRIYKFETEIENLIARIMQLEDDKDGDKRQYGISTSPSANKGIVYSEQQSKPKSITEVKYSSSQDTINKLNNKLKNQTDINVQLQDKIEELLDQLYVCEQSIYEKEKQIANFNRSEENIQTTEVIQSREKQREVDGNILENQEKQEEIMTLEEFVHKFEPSLMDTLFVMLRITEISVVMLQQQCMRIIAPSELLLQLDQPNKPQNIIVQLNSSDDSPQSIHLYESPQTLIGQQPTQSSLVWNIAMVFYYLICKQPYFKNIQDIQDSDDIQFRQNLLPQVESLIEASLRKNQQDRITLDQLLQGISQEINKVFSEV